MIRYSIFSEYFERCQNEALKILKPIITLENLDVISITHDLSSEIEFTLCDLFAKHDDTRKYWIDGVILSRFVQRSSFIICLAGYAWCSQKGQWKIPIEVELTFSNDVSSLTCLIIRLGDADLGNLHDNISWRPTKKRGKKRRKKLTNWLYEFCVLKNEIDDE